ncbi:MAG TPA: VOC family protein [Candidatus Eisenbacteria bacterium]|nr:VOC family protein [Candidatus Eisenbacteria bacterium]
MPDPGFKFSFDAVYYHVRNMDQAIAFYRDVLGFSLKSRDYVARFDFDGVLFELVPTAEGQAISGPGNARLSLGVSDIQAAIRYLESKGVKATPAKQEVGGLLSLFADPDGNELCLWQST